MRAGTWSSVGLPTLGFRTGRFEGSGLAQYTQYTQFIPCHPRQADRIFAPDFPKGCLLLCGSDSKMQTSHCQSQQEVKTESMPSSEKS